MKRNRDQMGSENDSQSRYIDMFRNFRNELDEHHDRRERVIKISRDITALSKKIIFALQRIKDVRQGIPKNIRDDIESKENEIHDLLSKVEPELQDQNLWRYHRSISPAIQELVEAYSFQHYIQYGNLIKPKDMQKNIATSFPLVLEDYVLGIFDLTGEMMRFAITNLGIQSKNGGQSVADQICSALRILRSEFESLDTTSTGSFSFGAEVAKKSNTMKSCVEKVENCCYSMMIRGSERPAGWKPDQQERTIVDEV